MPQVTKYERGVEFLIIISLAHRVHEVRRRLADLFEIALGEKPIGNRMERETCWRTAKRLPAGSP
ncbi:MAG: hypothetical protein AB4038_18870 [Prochloraceae cyanobacterium]